MLKKNKKLIKKKNRKTEKHFYNIVILLDLTDQGMMMQVADGNGAKAEKNPFPIFVGTQNSTTPSFHGKIPWDLPSCTRGFSCVGYAQPRHEIASIRNEEISLRFKTSFDVAGHCQGLERPSCSLEPFDGGTGISRGSAESEGSPLPSDFTSFSLAVYVRSCA